MLATLAAAALVLGHGPGQERTRVLDPASLRPLASSPAFPKSTTQVEVSPDGTRLAAGTDRGLLIYDARSGRRTARVRMATYNRVLSWLTDDRIAVVKRGKPTTVRTVSVAERDVVHREVLRARVSDTARVGDRQVTLNAVKTGDEQTLSVFGAEGTLERTVPLPGMHEGTLHGRAPGGRALVLAGEQPFLYAVDVATGEAVRHDLALDGGTPAEWLEPTQGDMLAVRVFAARRDRVAILDPETFAVTAWADPRGGIKGAGEGFVSYDEETSRPLVVYGPDGAERWRTPKGLDVLGVGAIGDRLYAASGYSDVRVRQFDLATGRRLRTLRGRVGLFEPSAGRVRVPFFGNGAISED